MHSAHQRCYLSPRTCNSSLVTKSKPPQVKNPLHVPFRWHWFVTCFIIFHFGSIGLSYATNWRRSALQDRVLVWLHPYLIGANWYQEMLPIEWISEASKSSSTRITIQTNETNERWIPILETGITGLNYWKSKRLIQILTELAANEDTEGLTNVLSSVVLHLEHWPVVQTRAVLKIRLEQLAETQEDGQAESVLYEASLARFPNGEFGLVPTIERHRSVRALNTDRSSP